MYHICYRYTVVHITTCSFHTVLLFNLNLRLFFFHVTCQSLSLSPLPFHVQWFIQISNTLHFVLSSSSSSISSSLRLFYVIYIYHHLKFWNSYFTFLPSCLLQKQCLWNTHVHTVIRLSFPSRSDRSIFITSHVHVCVCIYIWKHKLHSEAPNFHIFSSVRNALFFNHTLIKTIINPKKTSNCSFSFNHIISISYPNSSIVVRNTIKSHQFSLSTVDTYTRARNTFYLLTDSRTV